MFSRSLGVGWHERIAPFSEIQLCCRGGRWPDVAGLQRYNWSRGVVGMVGVGGELCVGVVCCGLRFLGGANGECLDGPVREGRNGVQAGLCPGTNGRMITWSSPVVHLFSCVYSNLTISRVSLQFSRRCTHAYARDISRLHYAPSSGMNSSSLLIISTVHPGSSRRYPPRTLVY